MFIQVEHRNANWPLSVQARKNEQRSATEKMNEKKWTLINDIWWAIILIDLNLQKKGLHIQSVVHIRPSTDITVAS